MSDDGKNLAREATKPALRRGKTLGTGAWEGRGRWWWGGGHRGGGGRGRGKEGKP